MLLYFIRNVEFFIVMPSKGFPGFRQILNAQGFSVGRCRTLFRAAVSYPGLDLDKRRFVLNLWLAL